MNTLDNIKRQASEPEMRLQPPLNYKGIKDLYLAPSRFFTERDLSLSPSYLIVAWVVGIASAINRIERTLLKSDIDSDRLGIEIIPQSWGGFWLMVTLLGIISGAILWTMGGWWFRVRLNWSGAEFVDDKRARLVYIYSSLVWALPATLFALAITPFFENYTAYWLNDGFWSSILLPFPIWRTIVSYKGARTRFDVDRGKARFWFFWLPITVTAIAFVAIVVLSIMS